MSELAWKVERKAALLALQRAGVWDPHGDLQAIAERYEGDDGAAAQAAVEHFRQDIAERCARIPLGHILGHVDFGDLRLVVGSGVFIPRQQSLALVEWVLDNLALDERALVYDLCAGSGAIGLSLWARTGAQVVCVERDAVPSLYLQRNICRVGAEGQGVRAQAADVARLPDFESARHSADLVVCNPPYVPEGMLLEPEWGVHHPQAAIFAHAQGVGLIQASSQLAWLLLKPGGTLLLEHAESQIEQVHTILTAAGFSAINTLQNEAFSDATGPSVLTSGVKV
ncbi:N5-glutamine methyltransferase family protein [Pseudomonas citronellolis]|uniref:N5-glutamine methyltransferase family protein n=1 Tax=Pseudomonas citronellolis TaxID=53408 RepID=UPI0022BA68C4|nr:HemK/PrmC family methyltransferase [Pseudomonas citronellolis]WBG61837.1 peptide chain release factor N(5)-glutamine methyltransferase [Pseudomonas citronellolis]